MATVKELQKDFRRLAEDGNLFHAYLFFGPGAGGGFAEDFAAFLETGKWEKSKTPLVDFAKCGGGIDDVRAAIKFLWQKPLKSPRKTLLAENSDQLTPEAQNAFLKIAEEPPVHALIILSVKNPDSLLPTLVSRFQKIYIHNTNDTNNGTNDANAIAKKFIQENERGRKEIIKELLESGSDLENFVTGIIAALRKDEIKNWKILKELLKRWTLMNQFNTNKKLQLEAALLQLGNNG